MILLSCCLRPLHALELPLLELSGNNKRRQLPLVYRCQVKCNPSEGLSGLRILPSLAYPGTLAVTSISREELKDVIEEGDRLTHLDGIDLEGKIEKLHQHLIGGKTSVNLRFIRKLNPHSEQIEESSSSNASSRLTPSFGRRLMEDAISLLIEDSEDVHTWEETADTIHGKPLYLFPYLLYEVQEKDDIAAISACFKVSTIDVRRDNRGTFKAGERGKLHAGQILKIRNVEYDAVKARAAVAGKRVPNSSSKIKAAAADDAVRLIPGRHYVREGESMKDLARLYGCKEDDLRQLNRKLFPLGEPSTLVKGMHLIVKYPLLPGGPLPPSCFTPDNDLSDISFATTFPSSSSSSCVAPSILPPICRVQQGRSSFSSSAPGPSSSSTAFFA